ncbi:MAG: tetratricopeptide repeat protein, partial [Bacteroidota bacterium]
MKQGLIYLFVFSLLLVESISSQSIPSNFIADKKADSVFFALKDQLEEARKGSNALLTSQGYWELGEFYRTMGVYSEALEQFNKALDQMQSPEKDTLYVLVNNCIGKVHFSLGKFERAQQFFRESDEIARLLGYTKGL